MAESMHEADGEDKGVEENQERPDSLSNGLVEHNPTVLPDFCGENPHQRLAIDTMHRQAADFSSASPSTGSRHGRTRHERLSAMVAHAKTQARKSRLSAGLKSVVRAKMDDIGALGIGMQLYFMLTKYLCVAFLCMGLVALPAIALNTYGHGITSKLVDPLQLAYSSLGNGGVNADTAASARNCLPIGPIDCSWQTVATPLTSNPKTLTWLVTLSDVAYSLVFVVFLLVYAHRANRAIASHQTKHLTPARYAVLVRGLPKDATERAILAHFNTRYDLTRPERTWPLWCGCCWGRRRVVKPVRAFDARSCHVVANVEHLKQATTLSDTIYLGTWIAEVSVAHPTGGLLRAYLSTKHLGDKKEDVEALVQTLEDEKARDPTGFEAADEQLIHASRKKLEKLQRRLATHEREIERIKHVGPRADEERKTRRGQTATSTARLAAAARAAKTAATTTQQALDWDACECAFVVFNHLESRRRCLQDYRHSTNYLARWAQPRELRFQTRPLIVTSAPEPSNILWENLEVTPWGRFSRQCVTTCVTIALLVVSCAIISAAQTTQEQFATKSPPDGLCARALPAVSYADPLFAFNAKNKAIAWSLAWDAAQSCPVGKAGEARYHISYPTDLVRGLNQSRISYGPKYPTPRRCLDPCVSDLSTEVCNTLPCFYYHDLVEEKGMACQAYEASYVLSCFCSTQLSEQIQTYGYLGGSQRLYHLVPCWGFTRDYLLKNALTLLAAGIVVTVNFLLKTILRMFAVFERHTSESTKTMRVAVRMFGAQFVNTALIVIIVNASFGLSSVPVVNRFLGGKYRDFEREWYPTVGMGIATTMLLNALVPQVTLLVQMACVAPFRQWYKCRTIRTQAKMDALYAGPTFDISLRYPMVLNTVFVTMVFCGGSPILLFIALVAATGIYWLDKLSILYLYSVKTTYDEVLGEVTLQVLPWTLALHLGFSAWMYGNTNLLQGTLLNVPWLLRAVGLSSIVKDHPAATTEELYTILTDRLEKYDVLGPYGLLVKVVYSHVMLMTILCLLVTLGLLLYTLFGTLVQVVLTHVWTVGKAALLYPVHQLLARCLRVDEQRVEKDDVDEARPVVLMPEFTAPFIMSVPRHYKPDRGLGYRKKLVHNTYELTCVWPDNTLDGRAGERKLTWETMQAPVKSYAIEANEKYRHSVKQVRKAWDLVKTAQKKQRGAGSVPVPFAKVRLQEASLVEKAIEMSDDIGDVRRDVTRSKDGGEAADETIVEVAACQDGSQDERVATFDKNHVG